MRTEIVTACPVALVPAWDTLFFFVPDSKSYNVPQAQAHNAPERKFFG
jgi:hypothetical protein